MSRWTVEGLQAAGFTGFIPFSALPAAPVPREPGVYIVLRTTDEAPDFLPTSPAGRFRGKDPTATREQLGKKWVIGCHVVYIGTATGGKKGDRTLQRRLDEYRRHGTGERVAHWGGRYLWQLTDSADLLVCWQASTADDAENLETALLEEFETTHGRLPFANLKRGRRRRRT